MQIGLKPLRYNAKASGAPAKEKNGKVIGFGGNTPKRIVPTRHNQWHTRLKDGVDSWRQTSRLWK